MALWACAACTTAYSVGAPCCPQCGSADRTEDRVTMFPMLRVACTWDGCPNKGNVREIRLRPVGIGLVEAPRLLCAACGTEPQTISGWPPIPEQEDDVPKITVHGGASNAATDPQEVPSSPGTSSSTSSAKDETSTEPNATPLPKRARKTGSRSAKAQTGASTAPTTDGDPTEPTSDKTSADDEK